MSTPMPHRIAHSWLALPRWVKLWLIALNLVLLAGFAFLDDPLGRWTVLSLPPVAVLLFALVVAGGGLTRLAGLGHLIPWLPLLGYGLARWLGWAGPPLPGAGEPALAIWAGVLCAALAVCLALDAYDVLRWWRGERFVLGSEAAWRAGASGYAPAVATAEAEPARCRLAALRGVLAANAASCLGFGVLFVALPASVAAFLGNSGPPVWLVAGLGVGLIGNGLHLAWAFRRPRPPRGAVWWFVAGDAAWVGATLALIGAGVWITAPAGITAALAVAALVAALGLAQAGTLQPRRAA